VGIDRFSHHYAIREMFQIAFAVEGFQRIAGVKLPGAGKVPVARGNDAANPLAIKECPCKPKPAGVDAYLLSSLTVTVLGIISHFANIHRYLA